MQSILGFWRKNASLPPKMCTPKKLLHRQQAFIEVVKRDQPMKINPPAHHQSCSDERREAQQIIEKYCRWPREIEPGNRHR
jgi:hypothetical protein